MTGGCPSDGQPAAWNRTGWRRRCQTLVLVVALASAMVRAEDAAVFDEYIARTYDSDGGMPDDSATAMVQTPDGFLWFGTFGGLVCFDGIRFRVFAPANTPDMPDAGVVNLHLDRAGWLWCSTYAGLVRTRQGIWQPFGREAGWTTDYARTFAEAPDGMLYVTGFDGKVLRHEGGRFVELPPLPGPVQGALGHCDSAGRFWAIKNRFVGYLDGGAWQRVFQPVADGDSLGSGPARDGSIWVVQEDELLKIRHDGVVATHRLNRKIEAFWSLYEHSNGEVWIASYRNGLYRIRPANDRGEVINYSRATGHRLSGVRFVSEDDEGNTWVGLNGLGLMRMQPRIFASYGLAAGLPEPNVKAATVDRTGQVWVGTYGAGVYRVDSVHFGQANFQPAVPGWTPFVDSLLADRQGRVWVATFAPGGPVFRIEHGQHRQVLIDDGGNSSRTALFEDSRGRVWLAGRADLVCCDRDVWTRFPLPGVRALAEDPGVGTLWAGNAQGLYQWHSETFIEVKSTDNHSIGNVLCLEPRTNGCLWIGTSDRGLLRRERNGTLRQIGLDAGLPSATVLAIGADELGWWWLASDRGVVRVRGGALEAVADGTATRIESTPYTTEEGLPRRFDVAGRQPLMAKTPDGRLWLASASGLVEIAPTAVSRNPNPPRVVQTGMSYLSAKGVQTEVPPNSAGHYEIPPGSRALTIEFAVLSYAAPERVRCATRLERDDQLVTSSIGKHRAAVYELLPPGDYHLHISAASGEGVWNDAGVTVAFRMRPHYWQTIWFRAGLGVVAAGLLSGTILEIDRWRTRVLRRQAAALEAERKRIARDLHDGCQQMLLATRVQLQLAREQWRDAPPAVRQALETAETLNRQTLNEARHAVWELRQDPALDVGIERQLQAAIAPLGSTSQTRPQLAVRGRPWTLPRGHARELRSLAIEAVTNALKHADARTVTIVLDFQPTQLVAEVRDDGRGFDPTTARTNPDHAGFGLISMRERAAGMGASYQISSAPGQGTCVRVVVPRTQPT